MPHISHNITISKHRANYYKTLPVQNNPPPPRPEFTSFPISYFTEKNRVYLNTLQYSKEQKMYKTKLVLYRIANRLASAFT